LQSLATELLALAIRASYYGVVAVLSSPLLVCGSERERFCVYIDGDGAEVCIMALVVGGWGLFGLSEGFGVLCAYTLVCQGPLFS
jgi:hypothetical protein